jgi:hypothetical protein
LTIDQEDFGGSESAMLVMFILALASTDPHTTVPAINAKPPLICRENESVTGTHVRAARRCETAAEWDSEDARRDRVPTTLRVTEGQNDGHAPVRPQ